MHCIVNRVDPADGRMAMPSKDRERLSQWAHGYERERGPLLTPKRVERYGPEAERAHQSERRPSPGTGEIDARPGERHERAQAPDVPMLAREPSQAAA